jgi:hypothetical protein
MGTHDSYPLGEVELSADFVTLVNLMTTVNKKRQ